MPNVPVTGGSGYNIDTRQESTNSQHRQVVVLGDPSVNANVVNAVTADPGPTSTTPGLVFRLAGSAQVQIAGSSGSVAVYFDRANPNVLANAGTGTFTVQFDSSRGFLQGINSSIQVFLPDTGHELGSVRGITNSIAVHLLSTAGTLLVKLVPETGLPAGNNTIGAISNTGFNVNNSPTITSITNTVAVYFDRGNPTVTSNAGTGTFNVQFDPGHTLGNVLITNTPTVTANAGTGTFQVFLPDTGHELGSIRGNTNTLTVFLPDTGHELGTIRGNTNTLTVFLPDTGHELGSVRGITNSIAIHHLSTAGTIAIKLDPDFNITQKARSSSGSYGRTAINAGVRQIIATNATRKSVVFAHDSTSTIYIGLNNSVTSAVLGTGFPLVANQIFGFDDYTGAVFGTTESGEAIIKYIEM